MPTGFLTDYGPTVHVVRNLLGLTRHELAAQLGVSMDTLRSWEVGRRPVPENVPAELQSLQDRATAEVAHYLQAHQDRPDLPPVFLIEHDPEMMPAGWQLRIAARVAAHLPQLRVISQGQA
ncbi:helix-turn-helix domain-containing protein [Micrococcus luteus]|uniref:helix-turn-helix domain-containing protein n=1 Tax=Micrococcus luteus TaxID=1270 RepID=UPI0006673B42|nr:helix-turn-helix transcriptional regulator [Micrococcus luteus]MBN6749469.1 DUF1870 family protein [Micrococcus luteus]MBN6759467.1 DUF1870 family protein [Micrococcus luteus]MBN6800812.1 DUF1870 family protein [Micrococcus luteus]TKD53502.1 DUF1870 family protein [Micrococcus luteus]